ncbi:MAG TPA: hypothetical protein VFQ44_08760 [Streptosporangiaceae bacterium]|nr:hypothetical protein [Streptosporangiaceae bacterium]
MRLTRARSFLATSLVVLAGAATTAIVIAAPASAKPAAPASSHQVVLVNCNSGKVKPALFAPGCMPSQEFFSHLSWTSWKSVAFGSGTFNLISCNPSCARGKFQKFPVLVVAWRAKAWPNHAGRQYFSRLTMIFTGKRPKSLHTASQTLTLSAHQ